jgi:hypothetical protein
MRDDGGDAAGDCARDFGRSSNHLAILQVNNANKIYANVHIHRHIYR